MTCDWYAASFWILVVPCWHQFLETVTGPPVSAPCKHHLCANQGSPICAKLCYGFAWPFARPFPRPQKHKLSFKLRMYSLWLFGIRLYSTLKPMPKPRHLQLTWSQICGPGVQSCIDASHILPVSAAKSNKVTIHDNSTSFRIVNSKTIPCLHPCTSPIAHHAFPKVCLHWRKHLWVLERWMEHP